MPHNCGLASGFRAIALESCTVPWIKEGKIADGLGGPFKGELQYIWYNKEKFILSSFALAVHLFDFILYFGGLQ